MFDLSKYAINDLLKDYSDKEPIVITGRMENIHPDYIVLSKTEITVIKREKDKDVPAKDGTLAK